MNSFQSPSDLLQNISYYHQDWQASIEDVRFKSPAYDKQKVSVLKKGVNFVKYNKNILKHLAYHRAENKIQQKSKILINRIQFPLQAQEETESLFMSKLLFYQQYFSTHSKISQEKLQNAQYQSSKARMVLFKKMDLQINKQYNNQEIHYKPKGILLPSLPKRHQNPKISPTKESPETISPLLRKRGASMYNLSLLKKIEE